MDGRDEAGDVTGAVMVFRDITERRRAEMRVSAMARFPDMNPGPVLRLEHLALQPLPLPRGKVGILDWERRKRRHRRICWPNSPKGAEN